MAKGHATASRINVGIFGAHSDRGASSSSSSSSSSKAVADGPVGQVLAGPVSECNKYISVISITMLT